MAVCKAGSKVKLRHEGTCTGKINFSIKPGCLNEIRQFNWDTHVINVDLFYVIGELLYYAGETKNKENENEMPKSTTLSNNIPAKACCEGKNIPISCRGWCKIGKSSARSLTSSVFGRCTKYMEDIKECLKGTPGYRKLLNAIKAVHSISNASKVQLYIQILWSELYY